MPRWTGTWLSGLGAAGIDLRPAGSWRGERFGLPQSGPGSVAGFGPRAGAFLIDAVLSGLVAGLFTAPHPAGWWGFLPLGVLYVVSVPLTGQTIGMRLLRLRLISLGDVPRVGLARAIVRFALLCLLVPALVTDRDGRGLHDRAARSVVVRA